MRELVKDLINAKISRRGFLGGMAMASYSAAAARSALAAVEPFIPGGELPSDYVRMATGRAAELLVDQLLETGAKYLFCANGSGLSPICEALVDRPQLQLIQATQEGQVVSIADGYTKASGQTAFGFFSRVGLPHSSSNMYNAMKDRTPLVLMSDNADSGTDGTDSHEDVDNWEEAVRFYTKWRWNAGRADRVPEFLRHAYKVASVMPGGPTHLRIPRDYFYEEITAPIYSGQALNIPMVLPPDPSEVERAAKILLSATFPVLEVGPEVSQCHARASVVELAELLAIPVVQHRSFYCDFPNFHPLYIGESNYLNGLLQQYSRPVDLYMNFGARPRRNGFAGRGRAVKEIHASVDADTIGRNAPLASALVGNLNETARALVAAVKSMATPARLQAMTTERREKISAYATRGQASRLAAGRLSKGAPVPWPRLVYELRQQLEKDAVVVVEQSQEYRSLNFLPFADDAMLKIGRTEGYALGWGAGASAGVKIALPNRQVIVMLGDGGFLFGQTDSLWTFSRYDIPVMIVIFNNHSYESTRWDIKDMGPDYRDYVNYLGNPDVEFTRLAAAYNIPGAVVKNTDELTGAIRQGLRTLAEGRPFMLDVHIQRIGVGAELTNYQKYSVAAERTRQV
jgi:benzoylformate decarboxylase